jgi:hypothetical protein
MAGLAKVTHGKEDILMKLKYTKFQKSLEIITGLFLAFMIIILFANWSSMSESIPIHYNAAGEIDRWGKKISVIILPFIGLFLYALISIVSQFPEAWNIPTKLTVENRLQAYHYTKTLLLITKMEMVIAFAYITYRMLYSQSLGKWFLPVFLFSLFVSIIYYTIKIIRVNKKQ